MWTILRTYVMESSFADAKHSPVAPECEARSGSVRVPIDLDASRCGRRILAGSECRTRMAVWV